MRLVNKIALVTGALSGIGLGIAQAFIKEGAKVAFTDINPAKAAELTQIYGEQACFIKLDVSLQQDWQHAIEQIEGQWGPLDIMVHSAGISHPAHIEAVDQDAFNAHMAVHGLGTMLGCQASLASMKKAGAGSIINISSVESIRPGPLFVAYGAAKAAMDAITKTVALYCGEQHYNIRVNSVHPAATRTPMVQQYLEQAADPAALEAIYAGMQPLGRIAEVSEIASAVVFLASDEASFMTGHQMYVDGGVLAKPYPAGEGA